MFSCNPVSESVHQASIRFNKSGNYRRLLSGVVMEKATGLLIGSADSEKGFQFYKAARRIRLTNISGGSARLGK